MCIVLAAIQGVMGLLSPCEAFQMGWVAIGNLYPRWCLEGSDRMLSFGFVPFSSRHTVACGD